MTSLHPDSTTALYVNYMKYALALETFLNISIRLMLTKLPRVFPVSYCKHVLMKLHLRHADYSICPQSLGHFHKNGKMQILSLFINVSLRQCSQTTVAFHFLIFYLKSRKPDMFLMRSLVLFTRILPTGRGLFWGLKSP